MKLSLKILVLLSALSVHGNAYAQGGIISAADRFVGRWHQKVADSMDQSYAGKPDALWSVRTSSTITRNHIDTYYDEGKLDLHSAFRYSQGFELGYRNICLGVNIKPDKILKKDSDFSFTLKSYGNRLGIKAQILQQNSFKAKYRQKGENVYNLLGSDANAEHLSLNVNAYAVLNNRFSMPAVFGMAYEQKRSAGSFMAVLSLTDQRTTIHSIETYGTPFLDCRSLCFGIGAGYGYNLVTANGWLLHGSVLPSMLILNQGTLEIGSDRSFQKISPFNGNVMGNAAVIKHYGKVFAGVYGTFHGLLLGGSDTVLTEWSRFEGKLSLGYRF